MNPAINFITIGVKDLKVTSAFYKQVLGWQPHEEQDDITFFKMGHGLTLALYPQDALAEDIGTSGVCMGYKNFALAINLPSQQDVDVFFQALIDKRVTIHRMPEPVFWGGYRGYFADPENNCWEVAYNPFLKQ